MSWYKGVSDSGRIGGVRSRWQDVLMSRCLDVWKSGKMWSGDHNCVTHGDENMIIKLFMYLIRKEIKSQISHDFKHQ